MGKGDRYRKVNQDKFNENFDKIFKKRGDKVSYTNDFKEQHQDEINEEWYEYCHQIQQVRRKYNLPDLIFTQGDKDFFAQKYIERRLN
jgi:signal peptidase I